MKSKLGEISLYIARGVAPSYTENEEKSIEVINQRCIRDFSIDLQLVRLNDLEKRKVTSEKIIQKFDVLINSTGVGTLGRVAQYISDQERTVDTHVSIVRPNLELFDGEYFGYLLKERQQEIERLGEGTTGQTELSRIALENLEINYVTDIIQQQKIAKILGDLDRKIEKNNQINETLEAMAQAIFKSWFVDFDPVKVKVSAREAGLDSDAINRAAMRVIASKTNNELDDIQAESPAEYANLQTTASHFPDQFVESELGMIPQGWEVQELSKIIDFNPPRRIKKGELAPYIGMADIPEKGYRIDNFIYREMGSGARFINGDTLFARITPCLENGKTAYVDVLKENEVAWGSTEFIVMRPRVDISPSIAYLIARLDSFRTIAIQSMVGTSGRQRADRKTLEQIPWIVAPIEIYKLFGKLSNAYIELAKSKNEENKSLIELRDSLLPRLLSGEVNVSEKDL